MAQTIQHDRYPKFVADQVLSEKSLNQMFGYLEEQQRLSRTTLIGIGILCGMEVSVNADGTTLTISHGVGVTSKGYLVPFPETTYTLYNDEFSAEQEFFYPPFLDDTNTQKFPLHLLHNDAAAEVQKPLTADFLADKVVVVFVELLKVDNKNCDPDSCDDKGCTVEVTHRPLLVAQEDINDLIHADGELPFLHEPACIEWPELKMPKYNVPSTLLLSSPAILKNFLDVLSSDFMFQIEKVLGAAYSSFGYYIKDEYPNNPFSGLKNSFSFLFNGAINPQQILHAQYYYDFFSDLILAYEDLRRMCNDCLALCCPNEALFPRHLILGNAISSPGEFRHHWISSPAFACDCCSEGRIKFLLKKIVLLIKKLNVPREVFGSTDKRLNVKITPSKYGDLPLSEKAIPYYYSIVNGPDELYNNWNFRKTRLRKGDTNLSYDIAQYNTDPRYRDALNFDLEPFNFLRVEGHIGMNWKNALAEVNRIRTQKRLPFDVVALNGDIFAFIQSLLKNTNSLKDILSGNKEIAGDIRCYFADIESQYDAQAAELRCTITKAMAFFYNLPIVGQDLENGPTTNMPISDLIRSAFPAYRTKANTYGEAFDSYYPGKKNDPYINFLSLLALGGYRNTDGSINKKTAEGIPVAIMYYLEKIHEALPDGLVQLQINVITQRLEDASKLAAFTTLAFDIAGVDLPASLEGTLDAIIRICKAEVFKVLFRNFLINYVLFIANQSFALYAYKNPGVQHKAGVTTGGTLILVYNDKPEAREVILSTEEAVLGTVANEAAAGIEVNENFVAGSHTMHSFEHNNPNENFGFGIADNTAKRSILKSSRNPILNYRNSNESVKAEGLDDIFEIADAARRDTFTDKELAALVNQFPEGTVIADFFVPNMCKSSCQAMNFIVMGDKEPAPGEINVKLDLKLKEYCEDDNTDYEIKKSPDGGELKIDGLPVALDQPFNPSSFSAGDQDSRVVMITYSVDADVTNIPVTVFNKPEVTIAIDNKDDVTKVVTFKNNTKFAASYEWNFGIGQFSTDQDPGPINFGNVQAATVILKAFNGPCENQSEPLVIDFKNIPGEDRSCTPIDGISDKFRILNDTSTDEFKKTIKEFELLTTIFIKNIENLLKVTKKEQFKLLTQDLPVSVIQKIIRTLNNIIVSKPEFRISALMLYEMLLKLVMFYACCQDLDVDKARVSTANTLKIMVGHLTSWKEQVGFKKNEKEILKSMLEATQKELDITTKETPEKSLYIDFLRQLVECLEKLAA